MLIKPDCIQCILKVSISAIRRFTSDEGKIKGFLTDIFEIPSMRGANWATTSPEVFELVIEKIAEYVNDRDPFQSIKVRQNEKGMEFYPWLRRLVNEDPDPLYLAVKLAIIGNSMDLIMSGGSVEIETLIQEKIKIPIPKESFSRLRKSLKEGKLLLYFGDNSGEVIFDRVFIETIKKESDIKVIFVARSVPTLNDVTIKEAKMVGIDKVAKVLENGIKGPLPGTILSRCSNEVRNLLPQADLVISKGSGNFGTLSEEKDLVRKIHFMMMCKCIPYANYFHYELYQPILANHIAL